MKSGIRDQKLAAAIAGYGKHHQNRHQNRHNELIHCTSIAATVFSIVGLLVAINFGLMLIALAAAIVYYNRFGQTAAIQMGAVLIIMLVIWVTIMPAHHLVLVALGILILATTTQVAAQLYRGSKPYSAEHVPYIFIAPLYVLAKLKEQLVHRQRLDPL